MLFLVYTLAELQFVSVFDPCTVFLTGPFAELVRSAVSFSMPALVPTRRLNHLFVLLSIRAHLMSPGPVPFLPFTQHASLKILIFQCFKLMQKEKEKCVWSCLHY